MMNNKCYFIIFIVFVILFSSSSCNLFGQKTEVTIQPNSVLTPTAKAQPTNIRHKFSVDGEERIYWLRIPLDLKDTQPAPVVFVLHGLTMSARSMFKTGFEVLANQDKFIVVYPDLGPGGFLPEIIGQILSDLDTVVSIDPKRIYATGFSMGGDLVYLLACEMSDTFAAVASVSGKAFCTSSQPKNSVSVIHIHGLADEVVPYDDNYLPVEDVIAFWVQWNDCPLSPQEKKNDGITQTSYAPCHDGTEVVLYSIESMGHKWPTEEMPAAEIIWEFFEAHPKP